MTLSYLIETYGYAALFIGTFLEGETILVIAGFAAHEGHLSLPLVMTYAFIATFISDQLFFLLGHRKGRQFLAKRPKWDRRAAKVQRLLDKHQIPVVLGFRFFYGLRNVTPFVIGSSGFPPIRFLILNALGAAIWAVTVAGGGYLFGEAIRIVLQDVKKYEIWILTLVALVGLVLWLRHVWRGRYVDGANGAAPAAEIPPAPNEPIPQKQVREGRMTMDEIASK